MSDYEKGKNLPLPSIFSNIRNAGRSSIFQQQHDPTRNRSLEIEPLVSESASSPPSPSSIPSSKRRNASSFSFLFDKVQSMPMFDKGRSRIRSRSNNKRSKRGFKVDLPPKFLLYTIFVFIVFPLILGGFFLVKQILFGSLQEDETHPLHKKKPRVSPATNLTDSSKNNGMDSENATKFSSNQSLETLESSAEKEFLESNNSSIYLSQPTTADAIHQQDPPFSDIPSEFSRNTSASLFPSSFHPNELETKSEDQSPSRLSSKM